MEQAPGTPGDHKLRQFFELSVDMLCTANTEGYFTTLNGAWEKTLGYSTEELMARPCLEFIHPDDRERTISEGTPVLEGKVIVDFENRYIGKDGAVHRFSWTFRYSPEDKLIYGRATEVTSRHELEAELEEKAAALARSNAELEQFASVVSHDLNTPMTTVAGFAKLLEEKYAATIGEPGREWIERVVRGVDRTQALIDDLLAFSSAGRAQMERADVDLTSVVDEVVLGLHHAIEERGSDIRVGRLPTVAGDRGQLDRLWQNLISNAVKFSNGADPVVEVSAEQLEDGWCFTVADNGVGVPEVDRERVFEPFERLANGDKQPGTGIGLAICERIVARHGGEIWIEDGIGGGTRVAFTIPASGLAKDTEPAAERNGGLAAGDPHW